jgi:hypothetical protein
MAADEKRPAFSQSTHDHSAMKSPSAVEFALIFMHL